MTGMCARNVDIRKIVSFFITNKQKQVYTETPSANKQRVIAYKDKVEALICYGIMLLGFSIAQCQSKRLDIRYNFFLDGRAIGSMRGICPGLSYFADLLYCPGAMAYGIFNLMDRDGRLSYNVVCVLRQNQSFRPESAGRLTGVPVHLQ